MSRSPASAAGDGAGEGSQRRSSCLVLLVRGVPLRGGPPHRGHERPPLAAPKHATRQLLLDAAAARLPGSEVDARKVLPLVPTVRPLPGESTTVVEDHLDRLPAATPGG